MAIQVSKRLFTVDEYERMAEAGILTGDERVELVEGEIVRMAAKGSRHSACVSRITDLFYRYARQSAIVRVQDPVRISSQSELEPDVALLRLKDDFYASEHPQASDIYLLVEVSDTTLSYDRGVKLALYAKAGIREVWIVSLPEETIEVYAHPEGDNYRETRAARRGDMIEVQSVPGLALAVSVSDILG